MVVLPLLAATTGKGRALCFCELGGKDVEAGYRGSFHQLCQQEFGLAQTGMANM